MAKLIIDTSTWLDIAKPRFSEILDELENQVEQQITVLLTSEIILEEWDRNKEKILNEVITSIRSHAKSALKMGELLPDTDKIELAKLVDKYTTIEAEQEHLAINYIDRVERLLKGSTIYKIDDNLKIEMANRALTKKAPFHNSKNNMADALLYFGAVEYIDKNVEFATDLIFVTLNHKEFSDSTDVTKLHPDLFKWNVHFYNNLAQALKMRKELIDEMDEYTEYKFWDWIETQAEIARGK
jgi:hypothetical protein